MLSRPAWCDQSSRHFSFFMFLLIPELNIIFHATISYSCSYVGQNRGKLNGVETTFLALPLWDGFVKDGWGPDWTGFCQGFSYLQYPEWLDELSKGRRCNSTLSVISQVQKLCWVNFWSELIIPICNGPKTAPLNIITEISNTRIFLPKPEIWYLSGINPLKNS